MIGYTNIIIENKAYKPYSQFILLLLICLNFTNNCLGQIELNYSKLKLGFNFELVKRSSNLYYQSDTILDAKEQFGDTKQYNQIYKNFGLNITRQINLKNELSIGIRIKAYGIKELFLTSPIINGQYNTIGFHGRQLNGDISINYHKNILLFSNFSLRPTVGLTNFFPIVYAKDSNIYQNFGEIEFMSYYRAPKLKLGYNLGIEIEKKIGKGFLFSLNANYYSPFINNYVSLGSVRATDTHRYWYKWQKKINGIYFGTGFKYILTGRN